MSQLYRDGTVSDNFVGSGVMWLDISTSPDTLRMVSTTYPLPIQIVSGSSAGTEYTEDAAKSGNAAGGTLMMIRDDALSAVTPAEGDWIPVRGTANGALWMQDENSSAIKTAVEIMDDWDETDRAKVNIIAGQAGITAAAGAVGASTPRVTLASDDPAVTALQIIDNFISGSRGLVTEDNSAAIKTAVELIDDTVATVAAAVPTKGIAIAGTDGTNARLLKTDSSGELQIDVLTIAAGDNNIGNVDIVTVPTDPFGANADAASATGSISAKLRFIANTGIPITGSVAVTNAGTFVVQENGAALTSLQLLDDTVFVDDAAFTPATSKLLAIGAMADETAADSVDEGDIGALRMTLDRLLLVQNRGHGKTIVSTGGSAASNGNNTLVAADASNKIKVKAFSLTTTSTTAVTCIFQDGASGTELWRVTLQAPTGASAGANLSVPAPDWLFATSSNTLLNLNLSGAITVHWSVSYFKEAS